MNDKENENNNKNQFNIIKSINETFIHCKKINKTVFITFIVCGYDTLEKTIPLLFALEKGGADIIELGIPYSEPQADGPIIQEAHLNGVKQNITVQNVISIVKEARKKGLIVPVILMGYYNNFFAYGLNKICYDAQEAGANGFLVVDLPFEESKELSELTDKYNLCLVPLVAPTTSEDRMRKIASFAKGFVYCVSLNGVTGERDTLPSNLHHFMDKVRRNIKLPVVLGFGLSTKDHVKEVGKIADGAVIGSKIIKIIRDTKLEMIETTEKALYKYCLSITSDTPDI